MMAFRTWFSALLVLQVTSVGASTPPVQGKLVGVDRNLDALFSIDPVTLAVEQIGPLGFNYEFGGLAYDPNGENLYLRSQGILYQVDIGSGQATAIGSDGRFREGLGLAFDSRRNQLLTSDQGGATTRLQQIDPSTGRWLADLKEGSSVHEGMAYNAENDELYGVRSNGQEVQLWLIDRDNPYLITLLNAHRPAPNNMGLAYDGDRDYVWITDLNGRVFAYDRNKNFELVVQSSIPYSIDALEFIPSVPEPSTLALFAIGCAAIGYRRRYCSAR